MWGGYHQREEKRGMVKAQEWRLVKVVEEDVGAF